MTSFLLEEVLELQWCDGIIRYSAIKILVCLSVGGGAAVPFESRVSDLSDLIEGVFEGDVLCSPILPFNFYAYKTTLTISF
jgi:hypothetical protein